MLTHDPSKSIVYLWFTLVCTVCGFAQRTMTCIDHSNIIRSIFAAPKIFRTPQVSLSSQQFWQPLIFFTDVIVLPLQNIHIDDYVIHEQRQFCTFLPNQSTFSSFSCLIALARTSSVLLKSSSERGRFASYLLLMEKLQVSYCLVWCWLSGFSNYSLLRWENFPLFLFHWAFLC